MNDAGLYFLEKGCLIVEFSAMRVVSEKGLNPIVYVVWNIELGIFMVPNNVECLRNIQCIHNDILIGVEESGDCV